MKEKRNWKKELERETLRDSDKRNKIEKKKQRIGERKRKGVKRNSEIKKL